MASQTERAYLKNIAKPHIQTTEVDATLLCKKQYICDMWMFWMIGFITFGPVTRL